jgi:putative ABC transport system permease protein
MRFFPFILANLGRNKLRSLLTGGAIMLAVVLVCVLLTMPAGMNVILATVTSNTRVAVHNKAGIVYPMPYSFARKIRQVDGVADAYASTWFGGAYEESGRITFPSFAVEADHVGGVYPDYPIPPEQLADFQRYRDGAIVGRQTRLRYGWNIGDRVTLHSTVWPVDLDFRIVGEIGNERAPHFWLNRKYLDEAIKAKGRPGLGTANVVWLRASDPVRVNAIMRQIDEMSRNSEAETASETEMSFFSNFFGSLKGLITIILLVTGLVTLCIVFIAANTASMAVRERAPELAVLKAIGFGRRTLFAMLLGEVVLLSTLAGAAGVSLAYGATRMLKVFAGWSEALGPLGSFILTGPIVVQGLFLSLFVGMLAGFVPSFGASRKPVAQTLREVF